MEETNSTPSLFDPPQPDPCPHCHGTGIFTPPEGSTVMARPDDPETSRAAADRVRQREGSRFADIRRNSHRHRLLWVWHRLDATDAEAATVAGLNRPGVCFWKRASELRQAGYIEASGITREDVDSGHDREVWRISVTGRAMIVKMGEPDA